MPPHRCRHSPRKVHSFAQMKKWPSHRGGYRPPRRKTPATSIQPPSPHGRNDDEPTKNRRTGKPWRSSAKKGCAPEFIPIIRRLERSCYRRKKRYEDTFQARVKRFFDGWNGVGSLFATEKSNSDHINRLSVYVPPGGASTRNSCAPKPARLRPLGWGARFRIRDLAREGWIEKQNTRGIAPAGVAEMN